MRDSSQFIDFLVVWLTTGCQLRCRYCYMRAGEVDRTDLDPALFATAVETLPLAAGGELQIAGGEPTLVPDIFDAVASVARRAGFARIGVQTNGLGIDDRFLSLVRKHRVGVGVSLDGPADVNDVWRGRTADVLEGMRRLDAAGIPFGVTTVLSRGSVGALPRLAMLLAGFGQARSIGLDVLRPVGRGEAIDLPSTADVAKAHRELAAALAWTNRRRRHPLVLREDGMVGCGRTTSYCPAERGTAAVLTPSGDLYPCASLVGQPGHGCGTATRPDIDALHRGLHPSKAGCANCQVTGCRGRCPSRALLSPRASALDCALRQAAQLASREKSYA